MSTKRARANAWRHSTPPITRCTVNPRLELGSGTPMCGGAGSFASEGHEAPSQSSRVGGSVGTHVSEREVSTRPVDIGDTSGGQHNSMGAFTGRH